MKRFLSLLASFGLLAVSGSNVIACGTVNNKNNKQIKVTVAPYGDDFLIKNINPVRVHLAASPEEDIYKTMPIPTKLFGHLVFADANGNKFKLDDGSKANAKVIADNDIKVGSKEVYATFSMQVNSATIKSVGILNANGSVGKDVLVRLGVADENGNLSDEICNFKLYAKSFISTLNEPTISGEATIVSPTQFDVDVNLIPTAFTDNLSISIKDINDPYDNVAWCVWPLVAKVPNSNNKLRVNLLYGTAIPQPTSVEQKFIITFYGYRGSATLTIPPVESGK